VQVLDAQTDPEYELGKAQKLGGYRSMIGAPVPAENLDPDVLVTQPADQGVRHDASELLNRARDRSVLVQ
jgi:hypothetical protein